MLWRRAVDGSLECFWAQRDAKLRFAGGFYAFPGGAVDAADARAPVVNAGGEDPAHLAACARELFEEILTDEEEHVDYLEAQLHMIKEMGLQLYLSQQMHE